ncbi:MAG: patatin-like phospholipase family protein [Gemmatimonadota bacterium]|nr:MAG: patatin-like phospholipase family protein [Gemmatimonadota bacterium]
MRANRRAAHAGALNGLVLSGGGARAAYQVGVLSYLAEKAPEVSFPIIVGVSAGAINAAFLAGHRGSPADDLGALANCWTSLTSERVFDTNLSALGLSGARWVWTLGGGGTSLGPRVKGLVDTNPLREFLEAQLQVDGIEMNVAEGRLRALGLTATRYATGQTVTFVQGGEGTPTWERVRRCGRPTKISVDHVMASGSIPLVFPAVRVDGEYYGDGSIRQAAPLAPAIHLGAGRLLAIATRHTPTLEEIRALATTGYPPPAQIIGTLFNTIFLDTLEGDAERLERINRLLEALPPRAPNPDGLRPIKLFVVRPSRDLGALAEDYRGKLPRSLRFVLRGLGIHRVRGSELLSYLIFESGYIGRIMELGYEDALTQWDEIERFFADKD